MLLDDLLEHLCRELLTLIVADDTDLYLLFVAEILVVMHLTRNKGVSTCFYGVVEQEITCTTTDRHLLDRALQQLITSSALHIEGLLHLNHKVVRCHRLRQRADDTTASLNPVNGLRDEECHLL